MAKLVSRLSLIADASEKAVSEALAETASFILDLIRTFAPVDTGALRDSYQIERVTALYFIVGSILIYSAAQEYGTSRTPAQPHVLPAFLQAEEFFHQKVVEKLNQVK